MGKQKKLCWKCKGRHLAPTGAKCEQSGLSVNAVGSVVADSGAGSEGEMDSYVIPSTSKAATGSNTQYKEEGIQHLILEQLQRVNQRLDKVEDRMDKDQRDSKDRRTEKRPKKLSSFSKRHKPKQSDSSQTSAESTDDDQDIPSLHSIRQSGKIQRQVDARIRELEQQSQSSGSVGKIKSKRGGNVEVVVKHRVAWPHESILGGVTRSRMSYDQLTMSQWVQGFCKNILDESDNNTREKMIQYMGELMEDATDFSWQGAKAAHAVLLCEFERGGGQIGKTQLELIGLGGRMLRNILLGSEIGQKVKKFRSHGTVNNSKMGPARITEIMRSMGSCISIFVHSVYHRADG